MFLNASHILTSNDLDLFIAHPVSKFVPADVPSEILGLMPATTDWYAFDCQILREWSSFVSRFDGLNKHLSCWDSHYYMTELRGLCAKERMAELAWPRREYFVQVARFDPAKGIPTVVESYCKFRRLLDKDGVTEVEKIPQLLLCGHGAVDDPDASLVYDEVLELLQDDNYNDYARDITVMRLPPCDQREPPILFCASEQYLRVVSSFECHYDQREDRSSALLPGRI